VTEETHEGEGTERTSWIFFWAWFCIGLSMLLLADAGDMAWGWQPVVVDVMVHVGATLLLAPLLPFVEKSLTRRVVQENRIMVQKETTALQTQVDSLSTRIGELQGLLGQQDAENTRSQDQTIEALSTDVSFWTVAEAMTVANQLQGLADGAVTLTASTEPRIDLTFAWQTRLGDGRFSEAGGTFLSIEAHCAPDPAGAGTPVIQTIWKSTEKAETVAARLNEQLRVRDRWNGPGTIDWDQVFRDLHQALRLSVAYKRRDTGGPWQLHGELFELHGTDWAITKAGIEYRPANEVVLPGFEFPEAHERGGMNTDADIHIHGWNPAAPQGADPAEWQHVLWRGLFHLPVETGPLRSQPTRFPCKKMPSRPEAAQPQTV